MARKGMTIQEQFEEFHRLNPALYKEIVRRARALKRVGFKFYGISPLIEVARYHLHVRFKRTDEFKINNNHKSRYARLIMKQERDLDGFFKLRKLTAD